MIGDAEGVLKAVVAKRAKSPAINLIVAEINLCLSITSFDLQAAHIWSEENTVADILSRRAPDEALPAEATRAERVKVAPFRAGVWRFLGKHAVL